MPAVLAALSAACWEEFRYQTKAMPHVYFFLLKKGYGTVCQLQWVECVIISNWILDLFCLTCHIYTLFLIYTIYNRFHALSKKKRKSYAFKLTNWKNFSSLQFYRRRIFFDIFICGCFMWRKESNYKNLLTFFWSLGKLFKRKPYFL